MPISANSAPSTMLRMVPLPRETGEDQGVGASQSSPAKRGRGTAEGGGGGAILKHPLQWSPHVA